MTWCSLSVPHITQLPVLCVAYDLNDAPTIIRLFSIALIGFLFLVDPCFEPFCGKLDNVLSLPLCAKMFRHI